ncbi:MAG: hypothetical protein HYX39_02665, partial [Bacteroidetes bacterium]|nr:hypothetical protein [Bacteroidota bacterium]
MQTKTQQKTPLENLSHLPAFADYLLTHKLDGLVEVQMQISREITLPLMRLFDNLSQEELYEITKQGLVELLTFLAQNKARQQINFSLEQWKANQLPLINKEDIVAEDITMITYLRKKSFLYFIPDYCSETEDIIELIKEIDLFLVESETAATNTYISLLKDNIQEHSHFIEKITNTSPGIIYVYDVLNNKEVYANKATTEFLGYSLSDITALGNSFVETLIHPGDLASLKQ